MSKILNDWTAHCQALERAKEHIEALLPYVPAVGSGQKLRTTLERAWQKVSDTSDKIDQLLTSSVQPLPVSFPWQDKAFRETWQLYRDYLQEQHGIVMESRMEAMRLKYIVQYSGQDRDKAVQIIEYYMAYGTPNVFSVNFKTTKSDGKETAPIIQTLHLN